MAVGTSMEREDPDLVREIPPVNLQLQNAKEEADLQSHNEVNTSSRDKTKLGEPLNRKDILGYISDYTTDDDDTNVFLQSLSHNYAVSARSTKSKSSSFRAPTSLATASLNNSLDLSDINNDDQLSINCRQQSTRTLVEISKLVNGRGSDGQLYRLLSAKRNHIQEISNDVVYLQRKNKELVDQNRLLVRVGKRQEAALKKYHDMKSELPHIIESHRREIISMREKIRRMTEASKRDTAKIKAGDTETLKLTEEVGRLRELSRRRNLPERNILNQKVSELTEELLQKNQIIEKLKHKLSILEKSVKQQVTSEIVKQRSVAKKLQELQCQHTTIQNTLKDREKELASLQHLRGRRLSESRIKRTSCSSNLSTSRTLSSSRRLRLTNRLQSGLPRSDSTSEIDLSPQVLDGDSQLSNNDVDVSKLPPISAELSGKTKKTEEVSEQPRRFKPRVFAKDTEEWRAARRRQWRGGSTSPPGSSDESAGPRDAPTSCTPTTPPRANTPQTIPPTPVYSSFQTSPKNLTDENEILVLSIGSSSTKSENLENIEEKLANGQENTPLSAPKKDSAQTIISGSSDFPSDDKISLIGSAEETSESYLFNEKQKEERSNDSKSHTNDRRDSKESSGEQTEQISTNIELLKTEDLSPGSQSDDKFSLIGNYPPRLRRKLSPEQELTSTGSDSADSGSPRPGSDKYRNMTAPIRRASMKQLNTIDLKKAQKFNSENELRTFSSLSNVDPFELRVSRPVDFD